jgi:hypothetical protein
MLIDTYPLDVDSVVDLYESYQQSKQLWWDAPNGYMVRSSSPLEGDLSWWKLSGVYMSVLANTIKDVPDAIRRIIDHNKIQLIKDIHEKQNIWSHPYIPIIIQPYIIWEFAGVISKYHDTIFIEIAPEHNDTITSGNSSLQLQYIWSISPEHKIMDESISPYHVMYPIIPYIERIISVYQDDDWIIEFSYPWKFILLQFKKYPHLAGMSIRSVAPIKSDMPE